MLYRDEVNAVGQVRRLFGGKTRMQRRQVTPLVAAIAHQSEIAHQRRGVTRTGVGQAQHVQLAQGNAAPGHHVRVQRDKIRTGADHDMPRADRATRPGAIRPGAIRHLDHARRHRPYRATTQKSHAARRQPGGQLRNGVAAFHPQLVRRMQRAAQTGGQHGCGIAQRGPVQQPAASAHRPRGEIRKHIHRLGPARQHQQAALVDGDAGQGRDLRPNVACAASTAPGDARLLAGHRDEAEIAHRCPGGARFAVDDSHGQAPPHRGKGMPQPDDPGPDNGDVAHGSAHCLGPERKITAALDELAPR